MKDIVLAVIGARRGSKGVPGKNLRLLNGKPLISYMINAAKTAKLIDKVIVSTEDEHIKETAKYYGAEVPFRRPSELADDYTPLIAVTKHAMEKMDNLGYKADIIVQLQPTCPFVHAEKIDESIKKVLEGSDCSVSLRRIGHEHPYRAKKILQDGSFTRFIEGIDVEKYQNRQDLPPTYCTTGAIYTRRRHLLENWSGKDFCLGQNPTAVILNDIEGTNIDNLIDFEFAEFIMKKTNNK